jgi:hypothetical protein
MQPCSHATMQPCNQYTTTTPALLCQSPSQPSQASGTAVGGCAAHPSDSQLALRGGCRRSAAAWPQRLCSRRRACQNKAHTHSTHAHTTAHRPLKPVCQRPGACTRPGVESLNNSRRGYLLPCRRCRCRSRLKGERGIVTGALPTSLRLPEDGRRSAEPWYQARVPVLPATLSTDPLPLQSSCAGCAGWLAGWLAVLAMLTGRTHVGFRWCRGGCVLRTADYAPCQGAARQHSGVADPASAAADHPTSPSLGLPADSPRP